MSLVPRKLTFQLTPLLDLLLIVIFAQYLDVRDKSASDEKSTAEQSAAMKKSVERAERDRDRFAKKLAASQTALQIRQEKLKRLDEQLRKQIAEEEQAAKTLRQQRDQISRMLARMFRLPEDVVRKTMESLANAGNSGKAEQLRKIRDRLKQLQKSKPHQILRHVVQYEELLKRCDIWEIHVTRKYNVTVVSGGKSHRFRYMAREPRPTKDEERERQEARRYVRDLSKNFATKLFAYYDSQPQTKSVIIVMVSHDGRDLSTFAAAKLGIQQTAFRISTKTGARVNMVVADLGTLRFEAYPEKSSP